MVRVCRSRPRLCSAVLPSAVLRWYCPINAGAGWTQQRFWLVQMGPRGEAAALTFDLISCKCDGLPRLFKQTISHFLIGSVTLSFFSYWFHHMGQVYF